MECQPVKILRLQAAAIKRLEVVEITPDGNLVTITGKNANGKSSVLDAITMALAGEREIPWEPVKRGHESAYIALDLGDEKGLEFRVTRKFTAKDGDSGGKKYTTSLTIEGANGRREKSPQDLLNTIVGAIAFDPLEWARMAPKAKVATLRGLVSGVDFDEIAAERQRAYDERTIQARAARDARARASGIIVPPQAPDKPVDTKALTDQLANAGEQAAAVERERAKRLTERARANEALAMSRAFLEQAEALKRQAEEAASTAIEHERRARAIDSAQDDLPPLPDLPDTAAIRAELDTATELNAAYAKAQQRKEIEAQAKAAEAEAERLAAEIVACDAKVQDAIAAAELPVRGLSFDADDVYLNGLPFDQAASSEQLRASLAIAMAESPRLRVIRVKEGALLDEDAMKVLAEVAEADGFQIWLETISAENPTFEMIDGRAIKP
jgi:energy-coupling factor transporter ATP-binding protein EcfA2